MNCNFASSKGCPWKLILGNIAVIGRTRAFVIGLVSYFMLNILAPIFGTNTFWGIFLQGFLSGILGILAGIIILYLLKNQEIKDLAKSLSSKFWKIPTSETPYQELT